MKMPFSNTTYMLDTHYTPFSVRTATLIWEHIALLMFASLLLYLAALPAIAAWLLGLPLLTPWVAVLTFGPTWLGIVVGARRLLTGEEVSWSVLLRTIRQHWSTGVRISVVPALIASVFMATDAILAFHPHASWLYLPLFFDGCFTTLAVLASLTAFSLPEHTLHGWTLWKVSLAVTRLQLAKQFGILALFSVLGAFVAVVFNVGLLPLLCVPLVICLELLTHQTCASLVDPKENV